MKKACIFILLAVELLFSQSIKNVSGIITNASGDRVSGVMVCGTNPWNCVLSNADGHYEINALHLLSIRFSHPGYNAVTKNISSNKIDILLPKSTKESDNKRIVPYCSENDNLIGWRFKVIIPSSNTIRSNDIDYEMILAPSSHTDKERLTIMYGPNVSYGIPTRLEWPLLEEVSPRIIFDRDVEYENQGERGIPMDSAMDIKAQSSDGKFWRYIGNLFEIIAYYNVSEESAREFDNILDTLCYYPPTVKYPK